MTEFFDYSIFFVPCILSGIRDKVSSADYDTDYHKYTDKSDAHPLKIADKFKGFKI